MNENANAKLRMRMKCNRGVVAGKGEMIPEAEIIGVE